MLRCFVCVFSILGKCKKHKKSWSIRKLKKYFLCFGIVSFLSLIFFLPFLFMFTDTASFMDYSSYSSVSFGLSFLSFYAHGHSFAFKLFFSSVLFSFGLFLLSFYVHGHCFVFELFFLFLCSIFLHLDFLSFIFVFAFPSPHIHRYLFISSFPCLLISPLF